MVYKGKASSGLALRVGERNSVTLPLNVLLPGPQWCTPICSWCLSAQTTAQGRFGPAVFISFPVAVKKTKPTQTQKQLKGERVSLTARGAGCQGRDVKTVAPAVSEEAEGWRCAASLFPFSPQSRIPARNWHPLQWVSLPPSGQAVRTSSSSHAHNLQVVLDSVIGLVTLNMPPNMC